MSTTIGLVCFVLSGAPNWPAWAGFVDGLEKVRSLPARPPPTKASLLLSRGECEGIQVIINEGVTVSSVSSTPVAHLAFQTYREALIRVREPSNNESATGWWPDPLIPIADSFGGEQRTALPFRSTRENPLILYLQWCAARAAKAGIYDIPVVLTASERPAATLWLRIEVLPFAIPATSSLPNSFGISQYSIASGHGIEGSSPQARKLLLYYVHTLLQHRISAYGMSMEPPHVTIEKGKLAVDFTHYDEEMSPFLNGQNEARFTTTDFRPHPQLKERPHKLQYLRQFEKHFRDRGWGQVLFVYAPDEPKPKDYPRVRQVAEEVHAAGGLPVLVTTSFEPSLAEATDILAPNLNCFFRRKALPTCSSVNSAKQLRQKMPGKRIWWYQSCSSHGCNLGNTPDSAIAEAYQGWASYMVDHSGPRNRAMGPLAFLERIEGELYFDTVYAYNEGDPWQSVWAFGGNGDGTLFYPGRAHHIGGKSDIPIESLRLKHIRDGLEDYEWLKLAERCSPRLANDFVKKWVRSGFDIEEDVIKWQTSRSQLAQKLKASCPWGE